MIEYEAKFFLKDESRFRELVGDLRGWRHKGPRMTRRRIFDFADGRLNAECAWVRVRQVDTETRLTFKKRLAETIDGMIEHEVGVSDFQNCCDVLTALGMKQKSYQESFRESWEAKAPDAFISLDVFPWLPPIIEVEAADEEAVRNISEAIGCRWEAAMFDSIDAVYLAHYDVPITFDNRTRLSSIDWRFADVVPRWLGGG